MHLNNDMLPRGGSRMGSVMRILKTRQEMCSQVGRRTGRCREARNLTLGKWKSVRRLGRLAKEEQSVCVINQNSARLIGKRPTEGFCV